ncbi:hypothetical protein ACFYVL_12005 [Streptomyces sp. NPDC004111]|uniref:hypothetical protein n=1 Tax=Streptomyces sp. NPDC004111 TaxID=3364690 RepID=UPI0036CE2EEE
MPGPEHPGAPDPGPEPSVRIGNVDRSAVSIGAHSRARTHNEEAVAPRDPAQERLLAEVRNLRADLARCLRTETVEVLDAELVGTEAEITTTGAAGPPRLARLRAALTTAEGVTAMLASAAAVGQAVGLLAGG